MKFELAGAASAAGLAAGICRSSSSSKPPDSTPTRQAVPTSKSHSVSPACLRHPCRPVSSGRGSSSLLANRPISESSCLPPETLYEISPSDSVDAPTLPWTPPWVVRNRTHRDHARRRREAADPREQSYASRKVRLAIPMLFPTVSSFDLQSGPLESLKAAQLGKPADLLLIHVQGLI